MTSSFVPDSFQAPRTFKGSGYRLEPLGPEHNERDHEAWMSSVEHIRSTPGFPDGSWPTPMPLERNHQDLTRHADDFETRKGFTYTILDGDDIVGCVYIYPSSTEGYDADVSSWVTASRADLDVTVWRELSAWIESEWPFTSPFYAPRA